jgi:hypothetical protein
MAKMSVTTLRKIRKELEDRAHRVKYNEPHFDKDAVIRALQKKFAKEMEAVSKMPVGLFFGISVHTYRGDVGFTERSDDKFPPKVRELKRIIHDAFKTAQTAHEEASEYSRLLKLASRIASLEVECLINSLATDDPVVIALLEEVRVALQK